MRPESQSQMSDWAYGKKTGLLLSVARRTHKSDANANMCRGNCGVYLQCESACFAMWAWPSYTRLSVNTHIRTWTHTWDHTWDNTWDHMWTPTKLWYFYLQWRRPVCTARWKNLFRCPSHVPQLWLLLLPPRLTVLPPRSTVFKLPHSSYISFTSPHFYFYTFKQELFLTFIPLDFLKFSPFDMTRSCIYTHDSELNITPLSGFQTGLSSNALFLASFSLNPSVEHIQCLLRQHISPNIVIYCDEHCLLLTPRHGWDFCNSVHI